MSRRRMMAVGRGVALALATFAAVGVARVSRAESGWLNLHLEAGPAFFLTAPQRERFGVGGAAALRADVAPWSFLGFQAGVLYAGFPVGDYDFQSRGLVAPERGTALGVSGGVRFRILNDQSGYALSWRRGRNIRNHGNLQGNLWVDLGVAYVRTGELNRLGLEAGLGYEMSLINGLQVGPFLRYLHVFQPDEELDGADATCMIAGLTFTVAIPTGARVEVIGDADGDGVLDPDDECPEDPEDLDGFEDEDGCPDDDRDGDAVPDADDECPDTPEDLDGFEDEDGCPDLDNDGDGIPDADDECPDEAEDLDDFEDEDGCPDPDNDEDGILDPNDECPLEPEVVNGIDDEDGCPDEADIEVVDDDILLRDRVYFDFAMARVRSRSWPLLAQIARLLEAHPEYVLVSVEGHCDDVGNDAVNQRLSERRAERVIQHLVRRHHVDESRLRAVGFGRSRPLVRQTTEAARQLNRRVEFRIVQIDPSLQQGRARPRSGPGVAPDLSPGGVHVVPSSGAAAGAPETAAEEVERRGEPPPGDGGEEDVR